MREQWQPIAGFDGWYEVSSTGRVRSWKKQGPGVTPRGTPVPLRITVNKRTGYAQVCLFSPDRRKVMKSVHRLVLETFGPQKPSPRHQCSHHDGNRLNNMISNLSWKTAQENEADKWRHGTAPAGERNPAAKLTDDQATAIRAKYAAGMVTQVDLAAEYGVHQTTISDVITGRHGWGHLPLPPVTGNKKKPPVRLGPANNHARLTEEDVRAIRERAVAGETLISISSDYPVSAVSIGNIVRRRTWRHVQ